MAYNTVCGSGDALLSSSMSQLLLASERGRRCTFIRLPSVVNEWVSDRMGERKEVDLCGWVASATVDKFWEHPWRELPRKKRVEKPV